MLDSNSNEIDEKGTTQSQSVSAVGSNQGNVTLVAGKQKPRTSGRGFAFMH